MTAVLDKVIPVPSEYFNQLPIDVRVRWVFRNTDQATGYSYHELADLLGITTMSVRAAIARLNEAGLVQLVGTKSFGSGQPTKYFWVEPL